jgi:hypothetical protein
MSPDNEVPQAEQTFADVLNGLTFTGRHSRDRNATRPNPASRPAGRQGPSPEDLAVEEHAAIVRAYAWTGGRTRSDILLEIETLVSTSHRAWELMDSLRTEHQQVAQLCGESRSVAEVSALLSLPLGVVRVLLGDMASLGLIDVHVNPTTADDRPGIELLERVLRGLTRLPTAPTSS